MAKISATAAAASTLQVFLLFMGAVGVMGLRRAELLNTNSTSNLLIDYKEIVSAIVVFGDSTMDVGNNNYLLTLAKSNFEPYGREFPAGPTGRFSDGKLVVDYISERIGYPVGLPYLAPNANGNAILTGINFASAASGWDDDTSIRNNVEGMTGQFTWYKNWQKQVVSLVGPEKGNNIISRAFYIFSTGTNDWIVNYYNNPVLMMLYTPDDYTTFILGLVRPYIQELYDLGGRNIAVVGLPPFGCLPSVIIAHGFGNPGCVEDYNKVAVNYNQKLRALINDLKPALHGGRLFYLDIYDLPYKLLQNPQLYGFYETKIGCCGTGYIEIGYLCNKASIGTCEDAYPYVWWDTVHPTTHTYSLLALDLFDQAMPQLLALPQL